MNVHPAAVFAPNKSASHHSNYLPALDYLRAAAALGVFLNHAHFFSFIPSDFGTACVQIFFALSGFLIGSILLRTEPRELPRFYFNRTTRIWIPYLIAIALIFVVTTVKQGLSDPKFSEFFFYDVTFVYNWFGPPQLAEFVHRMPLDGTGNHFWSICVEEQFYLLAPFVLLFLPRIVASLGLLGLLALNFVFPHYFASISLGLLLALHSDRKIVIGIGCAALGLSLYFWFGYQQWMPFVATAIVAACSWKGPQLDSGRILGGASYSFYLNGWVGLFIANSLEKRLSLPAAPGFAIALIISGSLALAHYRYIDRTIIEKRSKFFSRRTGALCCVAGFALVAVGLLGGLLYFPNDLRFR